MKYKVKLFVGGTVFPYFCYATSNQEAEQYALRVYPNATIIHTTAAFWWFTPFRITCKGNEKIGIYDSI